MFIFLKPDLVWKLTKKSQNLVSYRADEPSEFYISKKSPCVLRSVGKKLVVISFALFGIIMDYAPIYFRVINSGLSNRSNPLIEVVFLETKERISKLRAGDGMHPAAFRSLSAEPKKKQKNRPNDHRSVLLFYRAANSSAYSAAGFFFSKAPRRSPPVRGRSAPTKRGRKSSGNPSCGWPRISSSPRKCGTRTRPSAGDDHRQQRIADAAQNAGHHIHDAAEEIRAADDVHAVQADLNHRRIRRIEPRSCVPKTRGRARRRPRRRKAPRTD